MERVLTVSQLNEYVRRSLAADPMLKSIALRGEISNYKRHSAGHLYFTLKDEEARIACVMFRSAAASLRAQPFDGMSVVVSGSASLYTASGQYQFYVDSMRSDGVGALYAAFERLKASLMEEGLFDAGLKKPLPLLPKGIGVVTSKTGSVIHDITQVASRRHPGIQITLWPARVQGDGAAEEIVNGIEILDQRPDIDVIIIGRGGGSMEELWAFNEESVARAIFACKTPVVSAVGHETDFTIADFVADMRAATPSQAAELVTPDLSALQETLEGLHRRLRRAQEQRLLLLHQRLERLLLRLDAQSPRRRVADQRLKMNALMDRLLLYTQSTVEKKRLALHSIHERLGTLSPRQVMKRGYAFVMSPDGAVIRRAKQVKVGEPLKIRLYDGSIYAETTEVADHDE